MQEMKNGLEQRLNRMKDYLLLKYEENDWHGVADAAMDIREIIAKLEVLNSLSNPVYPDLPPSKL